MSLFSERVRADVVARAGNRCEYCRLPAQGQVGRFPIDHIVPRSKGGLTEIANLALSCPHCNSHKWAHHNGIDPETKTHVPLFNPRTQNWEGHFSWSTHDQVLLVGQTSCGRATIARLQMNHHELVIVRRLMTMLGLFP